MGIQTRETFVRGIELEEWAWTIPADLYNRMRLLLYWAEGQHVFVPIRRIQYLAVIDEEETIFINGLGGYSMQDGQGGRLVELAWRNFRPQQRQGLHQPVACEVVYYAPEAPQTMKQLVVAFNEAMKQLQNRRRGSANNTKNVVSSVFVRRDDLGG